MSVRGYLTNKPSLCRPASRQGSLKHRGKGRQFRALGFHSFRHAFISRLANADVPADVRKNITGHSSDKIHRRYVHHEVATQRRAIDRLPSLGGVVAD